MKRLVLLCCALVLCVSCVPPASAQMGMDLFKKPSIMKAFNPVVGKGALYETTTKKDSSKREMELSVTAKETVDGKEAFWMQFYSQDPKGTECDRQSADHQR